MSKQSKAKRDKRKKQQPKRPINRLNAQQPVQNHAVLQNEEGQVVAAIGLQGTEWLLAIGGQTMGNADNPIPMLAMLKHLSNVQEKEGRKVTLEYSTQMQQMVDDLAAEEGKTAEEYLAHLVSEFEGVDGEDADAAAEGGDDADAAGADAPADAPVDADADANADAAPAASDDTPKA